MGLRSLVAVLTLSLGLLVVAAVGMCGCGASSAPTTPIVVAPSAESSPTSDNRLASAEPVLTTSPWAVQWPSPEASEAARSAISDWPSGIAMVVLNTGYELYVVDHAGSRWSEEMQTRPENTTPASAPPFDGVAVSNNQQFVAYVDHAREIVVRSIPDGTEVSRVPYHAEGETQLRCLSSDGDFVALASVPPDLPKGTTGDRLPWRVTIVDMRSGEATIEQPLEDLVKERTADDPKTQFTLYSLDWLSEEKLLVAYSGGGQTAYAYDIHTNVMEPIPGMSMIVAVSDSGTVYGWSADPKPRPLVWDGSLTEALDLDADSAYALGGAFNSTGDALAIQAMSPTFKPRGWQLFRLRQGQWEPSGPLAENSWMKAAPRALSDDGTVAYTALEGGLQWENGQNAALLSYDFWTGVWQEWLGPEDLLVDFGQYPFVAIIPAAAPAPYVPDPPPGWSISLLGEAWPADFRAEDGVLALPTGPLDDQGWEQHYDFYRLVDAASAGPAATVLRDYIQGQLRDLDSGVVLYAKVRPGTGPDDPLFDLYARDLGSGRVAKLPVEPGTTAAGCAVSGSIVVWSQWGFHHQPEILGYDLGLGAPFLISQNPDANGSPAIDGTDVVYDSWNGEQHSILHYDLRTGVTRELAAGIPGSVAVEPQVDSGRALWTERRWSGPQQYEEDLYVADLRTGTKEGIASTTGILRAELDGDLLVFGRQEADGAFAIELRDLAGKTTKVLTSANAAPGAFSVDEGSVVWQDVTRSPDGEGFDSRLKVYDALTGQVTELAAGGVLGQPVIDGGRVVFGEWDGPEHSRIWLAEKDDATASDFYLDVPAGHPYRDAILDFTERGFVAGYLNGTFRTFHPGYPLLRAQMGKILSTSLGLSVYEQMSLAPFGDLGPDDPGDLYPHEYTAAVYEAGLMQGYAVGDFGPWDRLTRAQMVTIVVRALRTHAPLTLANPPADYRGSLTGAPAVHAENLRVAEYNGLLDAIEGFGSSWHPNDYARRGEVIQLLANALAAADEAGYGRAPGVRGLEAVPAGYALLVDGEAREHSTPSHVTSLVIPERGVFEIRMPDTHNPTSQMLFTVRTPQGQAGYRGQAVLQGAARPMEMGFLDSPLTYPWLGWRVAELTRSGNHLSARLEAGTPPAIIERQVEADLDPQTGLIVAEEQRDQHGTWSLTRRLVPLSSVDTPALKDVAAFAREDWRQTVAAATALEYQVYGVDIPELQLHMLQFADQRVWLDYSTVAEPGHLAVKTWQEQMGPSGPPSGDLGRTWTRQTPETGEARYARTFVIGDRAVSMWVFAWLAEKYPGILDRIAAGLEPLAQTQQAADPQPPVIIFTELMPLPSGADFAGFFRR